MKKISARFKINAVCLVCFLLLTIILRAQDIQQKAELVVQTGHTNAVMAIVFSPDGKLFASAAEDRTFKLWNAETGQEIRTFVGHTDMVHAIAFSPDGKRIASGGGGIDGSVKLWDLESGREIRTFSGNVIAVTSVAFSIDGKRIASSSLGASVKVWDIESGELIKSLNDGYGVSISFSKDGRFLASAEGDNTIRLWNAQTFELIKEIKTPNFVWKIAFTPDGKTIAATLDKEIVFWDIESGQKKQSFAGHTADVDGIDFSADGTTLVSFGDGVSVKNQPDVTTRIWDVVGNREVRLFAETQGYVTSASLSPNGKIVAIARSDGAIRVCSVETGQELYALKANEGSDVRSIAISADGRVLASGSYNGAIKLWESGRREEVRTLEGHKKNVFLVRLSPDGRRLASASEDKTVKLWDVETGSEIKTLPNYAGYNNDIVFSRDGKLIATAHTQELKISDAVSGAQIQSFKYPENAAASEFSPDGKTIAVGDYKGIVKLWNIETGKLLKTFAGQTKYTQAIAFSPDGKRIASSDSEGVRIWNLQTGKAEIILKTTYTTDTLAFSTDSKTLVTVGDVAYEKVRFWDVSSGKLLKDFNRFDGETIREVLRIAPDFYKKSFYEPVTEDDKFQFRAAENGRIVVRDVASGNEICSLVAFSGNDWLVVTPNGFFDGTPQAWKQVIWRLNGNTFRYVPVEAFFSDFYRPGLLKEALDGNAHDSSIDISRKDIRQPAIKVAIANSKIKKPQTEQREISLKLEIADAQPDERYPKKGSGARDVRLFRNGSLVRVWHGDVLKGRKNVVLSAKVTLEAGENNFTAYAFNAENVKSRDAELKIEGAEILKRAGTLYVLAVGVNEYAADAGKERKRYNLRYAVADADSIQREILAAQNKLSNKQFARTEIVRLVNENATKKNILAALARFGKRVGKEPQLSSTAAAELQKIKPALPEDALLIYFAGHGTARCRQNEKSGQVDCDRFYLIPHDGFPVREFTTEKERREALYNASISDEEMNQALETIDAGKLLMIIDACNSGQALEAEEKRRGPMNSRGLAQLAYEKGMYILTAAQSQQAALETAKLGHGLLTAALLEGMLKAEKNQRNEIVERKWLDYAAAQVPQFQLEIMQARSAENINLPPAEKKPEIVFRSDVIEEESEKKLPPEKRGLQSPRIFYRRELDFRPFVVTALR